MDPELMNTPSVASFALGEIISSRSFGNSEDFDGWNEDELFDLNLLSDCLKEFLEYIG